MRARPWIVCYDGTTKHGKPPYSLECLRCQQTVVFGMADGGLDVDFMVATMEAFGKAHDRCAAPAKGRKPNEAEIKTTNRRRGDDAAAAGQNFAGHE